MTPWPKRPARSEAWMTYRHGPLLWPQPSERSDAYWAIRIGAARAATR